MPFDRLELPLFSIDRLKQNDLKQNVISGTLENDVNLTAPAAGRRGFQPTCP